MVDNSQCFTETRVGATAPTGFRIRKFLVILSKATSVTWLDWEQDDAEIKHTCALSDERKQLE